MASPVFTYQIKDTNHTSKKIIVIAGPTAVGKTAVAIEIAKQLNSVILSADSRQCYRELNIGVARPSPQELKSVPHYFIASHSIHENIGAAFYEKYALDILQQLFKQHNTVVVTGGTGLYIKALVDGLDEIPEVPGPVRAAIIKNYEENGISWLQEQLQIKDPLFFSQGEMQNPQRMMRALEVREATGQSIISYRKTTKAYRDFSIKQFALEMPREMLNERINKRVDIMMLAGLEAEAKSLWHYRHLNALQTVGYKEMFEYFDGKINLQNTKELIQQNTRRYAKRQMTWFKKQANIHWIDASAEPDAKTLATAILDMSA